MATTQTRNHLLKFYRVLQNQSKFQQEFQLLKIRITNKNRSKDIPLFKWLEKKIATEITTWPEWHALIEKKSEPKKNSDFKRYGKQQQNQVSLPPGVLHQRFTTSTKTIKENTLTYVKKAITNSLKRFEENPDFKHTCNQLQKNLCVNKMQKTSRLLPLIDILSPSENLAEDVVSAIVNQTKANFVDLEKLPFPYRKEDHLLWNLALIMRVQSQLTTNYVDRVSRIVAAAEKGFYQVFCQEILEREVFSCIVELMSNNNLLAKIVK